MVVTVRYVFGVGRGRAGGDEMRLELPGGATLFEAMQRLGVSALELHAAVNGESAADGTVLRDGDEVTLIPAIQGGRGERAMKRTWKIELAALVAGALPVLGAVGVAAQGRVVMPIIVNRGAPTAAGRTDTRVTVDTPRTGGLGTPGAPGVPAGGGSVPAPAHEVRIITRTAPPAPGPVPPAGSTRVTVESLPGSAGLSTPRATTGFGSLPSYTRETHIRVQEEGTTTRDIRVQSNGEVDTPIVIVPE